MLKLPAVGMRRSVNTNNCDWTTLVDWILGSVVFMAEAVSKTGVADILCEEEIFIRPGAEEVDDEVEADALEDGTTQALVYETLDDVWSQAEERARWLGPASAFLVESDWIRPVLA